MECNRECHGSGGASGFGAEENRGWTRMDTDYAAQKMRGSR
jgi:hypothetical protein